MTMQTRSIGDLIAVRNAAGPAAAVAGGAGDATVVTGVIIDRAVLGWPMSAVVCLPYTATLGDGDTLTIASVIQHGSESDLSDADTLASVASGVQATGDSGGSTEAAQVEVKVSLAAAKRYVRVNLTPDLSAAGTDTARVGAVVAFGGANRLPQ